MTETFVIETLTEKFFSIGAPYIKTEEQNGKTVVTNVALPNDNFKPPKDLNWFELYFPQARTIGGELGMNARFRWTGLMQINICVPTGQGTEAAYKRYNEIAKCFRQESVYKGIRIKSVNIDKSFTLDSIYVLVVSIVWQSDLY